MNYYCRNSIYTVLVKLELLVSYFNGFYFNFNWKVIKLLQIFLWVFIWTWWKWLVLFMIYWALKEKLSNLPWGGAATGARDRDIETDFQRIIGFWYISLWFGHVVVFMFYFLFINLNFLFFVPLISKTKITKILKYWIQSNNKKFKEATKQKV